MRAQRDAEGTLWHKYVHLVKNASRDGADGEPVHNRDTSERFPYASGVWAPVPPRPAQ